jgi:hypothetical protein
MDHGEELSRAMASVFIDVRGPAGLAELVAAIDRSAPSPSNNRSTAFEFGRSGTILTIECDRKSFLPFSIDIDGGRRKEPSVHNLASRVLKKLKAKGWDVRIVPTFDPICAINSNCSVCRWVPDDPMLDWYDLERLVAAEAELDEAQGAELQRLLGSDNPDSIAFAVLTSGSPLSPYLIGRIRQVIAAGVYDVDRQRQLLAALEDQKRTGGTGAGKSRNVGKSIAAELLAAIKLSEPDRDSMEMDIEAGDFITAVLDGVSNARSLIPDPLLARIRRMGTRRAFGEFSGVLLDIIESHESQYSGLAAIPDRSWLWREIK